MICYRCNKVNADGARFCGNCGASLPTPGPQIQDGMQYQQPSQIQPQSMQPQPAATKKRRAPLIAGLAAGGTLLVAGIVVLVLFLAGVIGDKNPVGTTGVSGTSQSDEEDALTFGSDIPLQEITSFSFGRYNGEGREGNGYAFKRTEEGIRYTEYETWYDANRNDEVRLERFSDLTETEWQELLRCLDGAEYYKDPHKTLDETASMSVNWESQKKRDVSRDSIRFPDDAAGEAFHAFRKDIADRAETVVEVTD